MEPTFKIYVAGQIDKISPETMAEAFSAFVALLAAPNSDINWRMTRLSLGSDSLTMTATPIRSAKDVNQAEINEKFKELTYGLKCNEEGNKALLPRELSEPFERIGNLTTAPGVESITATVDGQTFAFTSPSKDTFQSFPETSIGSVTGKIDRINTREVYEFGLIDEAEKHPVKVRFKERRLENIKSLMGKQVRVRGELTRNQQGYKESLQMWHIEEIEDHDDLPTLDDDDLVRIWQAHYQAMSAEESGGDLADSSQDNER